MEYCEQHTETVAKLATIEADLKNLCRSFDEVKLRIVAHINEGEQEGGMRDRIRNAEKEIVIIKAEISYIKKGYWKTAIIGGLIAGLLARLAPDVIWAIVSWLIKSIVR